MIIPATILSELPTRAAMLHIDIDTLIIDDASTADMTDTLDTQRFVRRECEGPGDGVDTTRLVRRDFDAEDPTTPDTTLSTYDFMSPGVTSPASRARGSLQ